MTRHERKELEDKLEHARQDLRDAQATRERIAGMLHDDDEPLPGYFAQRLEVELHAADHRVQLWRDVERELHRRLAAEPQR